MRTGKFHKLLWILVAYTVLVIIWGAWVRISHSGDGCGQHWPLCEGAFIPDTENHKTWIEYFHRLSSGLYGIFVGILFVVAIRRFRKGTAARQIAFATFFLMIVEALLGAALVVRGLVGENATVYRVVMMTLHQMNSLFLVASTVLWAQLTHPKRNPETLRISWRELLLSGYNSVIFMFIPTTGAWAALANTLFPSRSLTDGIAKDFMPGTPWILKLRIVHPILALSIGGYLVHYFFKKSETTDEDQSRAALQVAGALSVALIFGMLTLLFLSPVWMKLVHLTIAQCLWITLVSYTITSLLSTSRYKT